MRDYSLREEWPDDAPAAAALEAGANYGLVLRWHAALAEMLAFAAVPIERRFAILERFCDSVRTLVEANPDLTFLKSTPADRIASPGWDSLQTIFSFSVLGSDGGAGVRAPLDPAAAREIYQWLNADLSDALRDDLTEEETAVAKAFCHIGQPVPIVTVSGAMIGALRVSAGARLVSGEPSHAGLSEERRLLKEIESVGTIMAKISLILRHLDRLRVTNPRMAWGWRPGAAPTDRAQSAAQRPSKFFTANEAARNQRRSSPQSTRAR